jgi:hypothetical protein
MWQSLIGPLSGLVKEVVNRVLPQKLSEEERRKLEMEAEALSAKLLMDKYAQEVEDVVNARALAIKENENAPFLVRLIRGLFRPLAGFTCLIVWAYTIVSPTFGGPELKLGQMDYFVILTVFSFYFGLRHLEKRGGVHNRG